MKNQVHALLERNMIHDLDGFFDIFGVHGLRRMVEVQLPTQEKARYLEELKLLTAHHGQLEAELARLAESDSHTWRNERLTARDKSLFWRGIQ